MTVTYRTATAADVETMDRIFRTSFCDTFGHLYRPEDLDAFLGKFTREAWLGELEDPAYVFRLAEDDGRPAGFLKLGPLSLPVEPAGKAIELRQLYVLNDWQGAGIAKELIDWFLAEARDRGAEELYLTVYVDNHRARRFYERYGFEVVGSYDFMVGEQADEDLIMRLTL
jgi:diamine N-acetyltransferase